jgi:two-component system OmpR family response regulator
MRQLWPALSTNGSKRIINQTTRDKALERVDGLNCGADDHVIKPFDLGEVTAQIQTAYWRNAKQLAQAFLLHDWSVYLSDHRIMWEAKDIRLTARK